MSIVDPGGSITGGGVLVDFDTGLPLEVPSGTATGPCFVTMRDELVYQCSMNDTLIYSCTMADLLS